MTESGPNGAYPQDRGKAKDVHVSFPDWEKAKQLGIKMLDSVGITFTSFSKEAPVLLAGTGVPVPDTADSVSGLNTEFEHYVASLIQLWHYVPAVSEPEFELTNGVADFPDSTETERGSTYLTFKFPLVVTTSTDDEQALNQVRRIEEIGKELTSEIGKESGNIRLVKATQSAAALLRNATLLRKIDPEAFIVFPWHLNFDISGSEPRVYQNDDSTDPYPESYRYHIWYPPTEGEAKELTEIEIGKLTEKPPIGAEAVIMGDTFDRINLFLPQRKR